LNEYNKNARGSGKKLEVSSMKYDRNVNIKEEIKTELFTLKLKIKTVKKSLDENENDSVLFIPLPLRSS
jgi:hypothetical protein